MLRHIHLAALLLTLSPYTSAWTFPDGLHIMPRQFSPRALATGSVAAVAAAAVTTAVSPVDQVGTSPVGTTAAAATTPATSPQVSTDAGVDTSIPTTAAVPSTPATTSIQPISTPPTTAVATPTTTSSSAANSISSSQADPIPQTTTKEVTSATTIPQSTPQSSGVTSSFSPSSFSATSSSKTTAHGAVTTSIDPTAVHQTVTTIVITSNGHAVTAVASATVTGTQAPTFTGLPGLAQGEGGGSSTLSEMGKKVIAGIVGGVGGALLMAGIAFAVYRVWFRNKREKVTQEDGFYHTPDSVAARKPSNSSSGWGPSSLTSKFSEPLDRYKSPTSPAAMNASYKSPSSFNASSNF